MKIQNRASLIVLLIVLLGSCSTDVVFDETLALETQNWNRKRVFTASVQLNDTITPLNFMITLRNTDDYPYRNLYVFLTTVSPDGQAVRDTIECPLASQKGKWLGKGFGGVYDSRIIYRYREVLTQPGNYTFNVEQAMRMKDLPGLSEVGLRIEKSH